MAKIFFGAWAIRIPQQMWLMPGVMTLSIMIMPLTVVNLGCGHYTQVVWHSTETVGCGKASCGSEEVWLCNYNPSGNWFGQKPY